MEQRETWIDFKELRERLTFREVLERYNVRLNVKGERATGFCPLPTHQGKGKSPSFSADLSRGIWQCFGCHAKGNLLDLAARLEGFDPHDPKQLRQAALRINERFPACPPRTATTGAIESRAVTPAKPVLINAPIDFELQTLDYEHPYLRDRGFTNETIENFGLGFCNRGMLKNRIAIPLHDGAGNLIGYAGRIVKDKLISEKCPKYLFPGERERKGVTLAFRKSLILYNAHRITAPVDHLFVVEGFPATWWLVQAEYMHTVALMGSHCSNEQAALIVDLVKPDGKIWLMPDGNEAGKLCALSALEHHPDGRYHDHQIAQILGLHINTVANIRKAFVLHGERPALERKKRQVGPTPPTLDGHGEAQLLAICCSPPPTGRVRWTLSLLQEELVGRKIVTSICCETIRKTLKKTRFNRGASSAFASPNATGRDSSRRWSRCSISMPGRRTRTSR